MTEHAHVTPPIDHRMRCHEIVHPPVTSRLVTPHISPTAVVAACYKYCTVIRGLAAAATTKKLFPTTFWRQTAQIAAAVIIAFTFGTSPALPPLECTRRPTTDYRYLFSGSDDEMVHIHDIRSQRNSGATLVRCLHDARGSGIVRVACLQETPLALAEVKGSWGAASSRGQH